MSDYKYPYIPKDYYPAVMFACNMIRENGCFNKAISIASGYYGVDEDELSKHVRARQAAGQIGKKRGKFKKYRYKGIVYVRYHECGDYDEFLFDFIIEALNEKNARNHLYEKIFGRHYDPFDYDWFCKFEIDGEEIEWK